MRAIIEIPDSKDKQLKRLARQRGVSRAQLVREAIDHILRDAPPSEPASAFGLWKDKREDGLSYERRLRREWPE